MNIISRIYRYIKKWMRLLRKLPNEVSEAATQRACVIELCRNLQENMELCRKELQEKTELFRGVQEKIDRLDNLQRLYVLEKLNPDLLDLFKPKLPLRAEDLHNLKGWFSNEAQCKELSGIFAQQAQHLLWRTHSMPVEVGIKVFEEIIRIPSYSKNWQLSSFIGYLNYLTQDDERIVQVGSLLEQTPDAWIEGLEEAWLKYMLALINTGRSEQAKEVLKHYRAHYGFHKLQGILPVAAFAVANGYSNDLLMLAANCYEILYKNEEDRLFDKLVQDKNIAVVGNGPYEIGLGRGSEIDSHDIVIRFSGFDLEKYQADYGTKTNVNMLYTATSFLNIDLQNLSKADLVVFINPLRFDLYTEQILNKLRVLLNMNTAVCALPMDKLEFCRHSIGYSYPSAGAKMLFWLKAINADILLNSIYGFAFKHMESNIENALGHYFEHSKVLEHSHDFGHEIKQLRRFFATETVNLLLNIPLLTQK